MIPSPDECDRSEMPLTVMAVPGLDPGIVPAIHAVQPQQREEFCTGAPTKARWIAFDDPRLAHGVGGRDNPRIKSGDGHDGIG